MTCQFVLKGKEISNYNQAEGMRHKGNKCEMHEVTKQVNQTCDCE